MKDLCVVKFKNGKYAIRKGESAYWYFDFNSTATDNKWWGKESIYFVEDCITTDFDKAKEIVDKIRMDDISNFQNETVVY